MADARKAVQEILRRELALMLTDLKRDTPDNFRRKAHNFLLAPFPADVLFYTVFTSSFESKSGNALESCAKQIARLRYGPDSVPPVIRGQGATDADISGSASPLRGRQVILTRKHIADVERHARAVLNAHRRTGRGRDASFNTGVTQQVLQDEIIAYACADSAELHEKPVDLFIQPQHGPALCIEVKLGGDLDSSNAPAQIAKFLTTCALAGRPALHGYFATIYNKDGEGRRFTGTVTVYLAADMIRAGSAFWSLILPEEVSFQALRALYSEALDYVGMYAAIRELVAGLPPQPDIDKSEVISHLTE